MSESITDPIHDGQAKRYCNWLKDPETGERCRNSAGKGTSHPGFGACRSHGGTSHNLVKAAAKQEVASLATDIDIDPDTVLLSTIGRAWGAVYWCAERIEAIQEEAENLDPENVKRRSELSKLLIVMNQLYGDWLDRASKYAKLAKDAGIAERLIKLEEDKAKMVTDLIKVVLEDLHLSDDQQAAVPEVMRRAMRNLQLIQGGKTA